MGNKSSRPPPRRRRPRIHRDYFGPFRTADPSWLALESATPLDPLELIASETIDRSGTADGRLSLYEAWDFAMAWRETLLDKVCLVKECHGPKSSIIDSVAWVRFKVRLDDHAEVSVARAAAVTWMKLASCPGYSGQENPVFWKCVFSEYCKRLDPSDFYRVDNGVVYSLDDSVEFFTQGDHAFPRYMIDGDTVRDSKSWVGGLKLFCGAGDEDMDPQVQTKLELLTKRIDYFIRKKTIGHRVDVCLGRLRNESLVELCEAVPTILHDLKTKPFATSSLASPTLQFRLVQLNFDPLLKLSDDADVERLCELMRRSPVTIGQLDMSISEEATLSTSARAKLSAHVLLQREQLPWLAYAMFHPDAAKSSWKALEVGDVQFSQRSAAVMEAMALGNNLEALLLEKPSTYTSYCSATLAPGAIVKAKPSSFAETIVQACDNSTRVDVSPSLAPPNPLSWPRWARVVIPGYGSGWVRSRDLTDVHAHSPGTANLRSLKLQKLHIRPADHTMEVLVDWLAETEEADRESSGFLPGFLALVCPNLRYLNIRYFADVESTSTLSAALMSCPSLAVLVVKHRGWLWHGPAQANEQRLPCLEQLDLNVEGRYGQPVFETPHSDHLSSSLSRLTALRIRANTNAQFIDSQPAIAAVLSDVASLHYFHWLDTGGHVLLDRYLPRSYTQTHAWSSQLLSQLSWKDDNHLYVYDKSRRHRVAAFLSVGNIASHALTTQATAEEGRNCSRDSTEV